MPYNIPALIRISEHIKANPERHDQNTWARHSIGCGTTHCIAGWAAALAERTFTDFTGHWNFGEFAHSSSVLIATDEDGERGLPVRELENGERVVSVDDWAADYLGFTDEDVSDIFFEFNEGKALRRLDDLIERAQVEQAAPTS